MTTFPNNYWKNKKHTCDVRHVIARNTIIHNCKIYEIYPLSLFEADDDVLETASGHEP